MEKNSQSRSRQALAGAVSFILALVFVGAPALPASVASGTVTFSNSISTNVGQTVYDGQNGYSDDIAGIQLNFFGAASAANAAARISTGSLVYFAKDDLGSTYDIL